jgi:hypothetical protein
VPAEAGHPIALGLDVDVEAALGAAMGVGDVVTEAGLGSSDLTDA